MKKKVKEPSLLRQIITIHYEQAKRRKALRILKNQEWSIDFLVLLLQRATVLSHHGITMTVTNKQGQSVVIHVNDRPDQVLNLDDNIFNHLDDNVAVEQFIRQNGR